jgi:hypothetical protein
MGHRSAKVQPARRASAHPLTGAREWPPFDTAQTMFHYFGSATMRGQSKGYADGVCC